MASRRQRCCNGLDRGGCWRPLEPGLPERVTVTIRTGGSAGNSRSRRAVQHSVDNAHDGHLKRFGILTLFAAQEPKSNEVVDFRYVQRDTDVPHPFPTAPTIEAHALGSGGGRAGSHLCGVSTPEQNCISLRSDARCFGDPIRRVHGLWFPHADSANNRKRCIR